MSKKTYYQLLKDPRWQKKRLEILQRDCFTCQKCWKTDVTLHVHHISYTNGNPWEIHDGALITLCENCHEKETEDIKGATRDLIKILKDGGMMASDFNTLSQAFIDCNRRLGHAPNMAILTTMITDESNWIAVEHEIMSKINEFFGS